jgi:hypothetical protein
MRRNASIATATLAGLLALATLAGCSREKIDWKSAEAADTVEGYDHFIERHPDSALVTQARTRVAQLNEDRDWKRATATDTAEGYREFLAQHESGKWAEEARIRIENFALDGTATGPARPLVEASPTAPVAATAPPTHGPRDTPAAAAAPRANAGSSSASGARATSPVPEQKHLAATPPAKAAVLPDATAKPPTAAARPVTTAAPGAAPSSSFGIQLGAFRTQDAALKNWKQLQVRYDADLHGLFAHAVPVKQTSGQLFRLQAPVGEESRARAICASLSKKSQPCVIVLPQPQVSAGR